MKHTIQIHLDNDQIYFAFLRKKSEYGARTWSEMVHKICNMPVLSDEDTAKCKMLYEVMGKTKSQELKAKCQNKLRSYETAQQDIINGNQQCRKALDELISKRDELMELVDDPDLDANRHKQCLKMLVFMNRVIEEERKAQEGII